MRQHDILDVMNSPAVLTLPLLYLRWHYSAAWADLWRLFTNLAWFLFNFFSIRILTMTLIAPWKRLHESRLGAGSLPGALILNTITRLVGFLIRLITIGMGLCSLLLLAVFFFAFLLLWLLMPVLPFMLVLNGIVGLFTL